MRVVTYARVSSPRQSTLGKSLVSQSQKFERWRERGGHEIVRGYEERQSATTIVKRRLFGQMLDELAQTQPEVIVVDSSDRFSRNLEDAFEVIKRLRERGIRIWPLEWERDDPPDTITYDSPDYLRLRDEIIGAQHEAKRIKTRILRSYAARRERGATTTSRPGFGMIRVGDQLQPSADAAIVSEAEERLLAGERIEHVAAWAQALSPDAWSSRQGLWWAIQAPTYVEAGVRSPDRQAQLTALVERSRARFGNRRVHEHEFAGVFACGQCLDLGVPEAETLMAAWNAVRTREGNRLVPSVGCQHKVKHSARRHPVATFVVARLEPAWKRFTAALTADDAIERWAVGAASASEVRHRIDLERGLARLDQEEALFASRRAKAFDLLSDKTPALVSQARRALVELDAEEQAWAKRRAALRADLSRLVAPVRNVETMRARLLAYGEHYARWTLAERNRANRLLCEALGSHPRVQRDGRHGWAPVVVSWPGVSEHIVQDDGLANRAAPRLVHSLP